MVVGCNSATVKADKGGKTKPLNNSYSLSMAYVI